MKNVLYSRYLAKAYFLLWHPILITWLLLVSFSGGSLAVTGKWVNKVPGDTIAYRSTETASPIKDFAGNYLTIVYLENLGFNLISDCNSV